MRPASLIQSFGTGNRLRYIGDENSGQDGNGNLSTEEGQAEHDQLGDAVEHGSENNRKSRAARLLSTRRFSLHTPQTVDQQIPAIESQRSGEQTRGHTTTAG